MSSFTVIVPVTSRGWQRSFCIDELCWSTIVDHDAGVCVCGVMWPAQLCYLESGGGTLDVC